MQISQAPHAGDLVSVRRRRWRVVDVRAHDDCQVVTLSGAGHRNIGVERRVIAPFETVESPTRPARLRVVSPQRWRRACRALLAKTSPAGALRAGRRARIDLLPHQLEPALAVVRGLGTRLLLADDVGLGKTIQAALVLAELRERAIADRALILTPASLRDQWASELMTRFDLEATVVDARDLRRRLVELPIGQNPWSTVPVAVASVDYVKRAETLPPVGACRWDVLIVDEAHASAGDSERHHAVAALAARSAYVLLLTATPHSGDAHAFLSLCASGAHDDPLLVFRRTRRDVCLGANRRIHRLHVRPNKAELRMHALVATLSRAVRDTWRSRERQTDCDHEVRNDGAGAEWLALAVLNKRALSSAQSLLRTVERRLAGLTAATAARHGQLALPLTDPDGETDNADQPPDLTDLGLGDPQRERAMLSELADAAHRAAEQETKIAALVRLLRRVAEPALIFSEYRDTLLHLQRVIGRPAAVLHGGLTRQERAMALDDFASGHRSILLATDAAGEGLNLQLRCRTVINLELPWNPMRLEQRIGRVDRIGQRRTVHAFHLIARDTAEVRILERLRARLSRAQADIDTADPVGTDDDRATTRLVIDGVDEESPVHIDEPHTGQRELRTAATTTTLKSEATAEAARLTEARLLTVARDEDALGRLDRDGTWLMFTKRRATRAKLGQRIMLVLRTALDDDGGHLVESMLVPVTLDWRHVQPRLGDLDGLEEVLKAITPAVLSHVDVAIASSWRDQVMAIRQNFIETRLLRERAIAALADRSIVPFQPGLFDRRAERQHVAAGVLVAEATAEAGRRIAALERASHLSARPAQLLLVLLP